MDKKYFYYRIGGRLRTCPCKVIKENKGKALVVGINDLAILRSGRARWISADDLTDERIDPNPYTNELANDDTGEDFNISEADEFSWSL